MTYITTVPTSELERDLLKSNQDIALCEIALALGITSYRRGSVKERLETNRRVVKVITAELARRRTLNVVDAGAVTGAVSSET